MTLSVSEKRFFPPEDCVLHTILPQGNALLREQHTLLIQSSRVSGKLPVGRYHTMAGNDDRDRIMTDGAAHGLRSHPLFPHPRCGGAR